MCTEDNAREQPEIQVQPQAPDGRVASTTPPVVRPTSAPCPVVHEDEEQPETPSSWSAVWQGASGTWRAAISTPQTVAQEE